MREGWGPLVMTWRWALEGEGGNVLKGWRIEPAAVVPCSVSGRLAVAAGPQTVGGYWPLPPPPPSLSSDRRAPSFVHSVLCPVTLNGMACWRIGQGLCGGLGVVPAP